MTTLKALLMLLLLQGPELLGRRNQCGVTARPAHTAATELCLPPHLLRAVVMSSKDALPLPATSIKNI